ncbi:oligogalacturonate-specific porin KdgM family protein [Photobacterium profundum]
MKFKLLTSSLLLALMSTAASATSINLRHEYMPDREGDQHRDRITVSHRFDNGMPGEWYIGYRYGSVLQFIEAPKLVRPNDASGNIASVTSSCSSILGYHYS